MEEKANVEIKKTIDSLEFLIDEDCSDTQFDYIEEIKSVIKALTELQQYHAIGTPEECRTAREKQMPKKPIMKQLFKYMEERYLCCPTCGGILTDRIPGDNKTFYFHCMNCGQKLDWSDEE